MNVKTIFLMYPHYTGIKQNIIGSPELEKILKQLKIPNCKNTSFPRFKTGIHM